MKFDPDNNLYNPAIARNENYTKAAKVFLRRAGVDPSVESLYLNDTMKDLAFLAEKINALKSVGAI